LAMAIFGSPLLCGMRQVAARRRFGIFADVAIAQL